MSKTTLSKEIQKELKKLNDAIDRKIIRGKSFEKEAHRHKELLATLQHINEDSGVGARVARKASRRSKSPVHRSLAGGAVRRMFRFGVA